MSLVLSIPLFVLFVVIVGKLAGRLLGIRLGHWRGALVGAVGWIAGLYAAAYTIGTRSKGGGRVINATSFGHWLQAAAVVIAFGVLAGMPFAIGLDLVTRSARGGCGSCSRTRAACWSSWGRSPPRGPMSCLTP